jgi:hypothetical protein
MTVAEPRRVDVALVGGGLANALIAPAWRSAGRS